MAIKTMILNTSAAEEINETLESDLEINLSNKELLVFILIELKMMNYYLHQGLNIKDNSTNLIKDFTREVQKINQ